MFFMNGKEGLSMGLPILYYTVLFFFGMLGIIYITFSKKWNKKEKKESWFDRKLKKFDKLFSIIIVVSYSLFLILGLTGIILSYIPLSDKKIVTMDGEMIKTNEALLEGENYNFYYVTVETGYAHDMEDLLSIFMHNFTKDPQFNSQNKTILIYQSEEEQDQVSAAYLEEVKAKVFIAVFNELNRMIDYNKKLVVDTIFKGSGFQANSVFKKGDILLEVDNRIFIQRKDLFNYLEKNQQIKTISIKVKRKNEVKELKLDLNDKYKSYHALGFWPKEVFELENTLPKLDTSSIDGGDSAGLMFALQSYYDLSQKNVPKGYKIAGTGGIDETGKVNGIGGIRNKVNTVYENGADIFFVPKYNEKDALEQQKKIGANRMKIIPIDNLKEAIMYIDNL